MERSILACSGMAWKMGKNFVNMSVNSTTDLNCYFVFRVIFKTVGRILFCAFGSGLGLIMDMYEHEES